MSIMMSLRIIEYLSAKSANIWTYSLLTYSMCHLYLH